LRCWCFDLAIFSTETEELLKVAGGAGAVAQSTVGLAAGRCHRGRLSSKRAGGARQLLEGRWGTQELADTDEKNAQAKEDIADTRKSLGADEQFLMMLKEKCKL
jgi:hypothetical protein